MKACNLFRKSLALIVVALCLLLAYLDSADLPLWAKGLELFLLPSLPGIVLLLLAGVPRIKRIMMFFLVICAFISSVWVVLLNIASSEMLLGDDIKQLANVEHLEVDEVCRILCKMNNDRKDASDSERHSWNTLNQVRSQRILIPSIVVMNALGIIIMGCKEVEALR